ncbi:MULTISPECIES: hypothetical protein [unclassified Sphingobium]|uniref:capsular polysaccharide export protein, LipB/KpsS family n=1 Tax=unclassified Sphingobium TaxID=2611147 RepID=UPI0022241120|nr:MULTISPECIES: hypothetical protein [unclassified Sphingobium]MCW2411763.1 capsular polysaccharide export protein [Sphingobium sp. B8D3D]MCW2415940.1 capsular polysaccharide export protein [Sphingobium sp. B8D3A]
MAETRIARAVFEIPPFPGAKPFDHVRSAKSADTLPSPRALLTALRQQRLGGTFWQDRQVLAAGSSAPPDDAAYTADDPQAFLDAIAGRKVHVKGQGPFSGLSEQTPGAPETERLLEDLVARFLLEDVRYCSPFTGEPIGALELVTLFAEWRELLDANRSIAAAFGFAGWKRDTVHPLLWGGRPVPFLPATPEALDGIAEGAAVAVWKARVPAPFLSKVEAGPWRVLEVEDGFIRSAGLGADCIPPLSIVADDLGVHYDPSRPNRLEEMLALAAFPPAALARAQKLREWIVKEGIGKYGVGAPLPTQRADRAKRHLLVVGQVEDDRSVQFGGGDVRSNLELLQRVRASAPDAWIIYRPHPDVEAGHRTGGIPQRLVLEIADAIEPSRPISALIRMVDEVHVITSLAGFEALLHGKIVTTHGTPFYAGWGLTTDRGRAVPRRRRQRTIDELVAAVLLDYPRYLDPVTNLPCPAEMLIVRLISGVQRQNFALVPVRRLLGWTRRASAQILGLR